MARNVTAPPNPGTNIFGEPCTRQAYLEEKDRIRAEVREERECDRRRRLPGYATLKDTRLRPGE